MTRWILQWAAVGGVVLLTLAEPAPGNLALAAALAAVLVGLASRRGRTLELEQAWIGPVALLRFAAIAGAAIATGSLGVAAVIVGLRRARPGVIEIPLDGWLHSGAVLASLLVSIGPGTSLIDIDHRAARIRVHALDAGPVAARRLVELYAALRRELT